MADFRENALEWIERQKTITATISSKRFKNKIYRMAEEYPGEVQIVHENTDGTILAKIPLSYLKIYRSSDVHRELSDEDRERLRNQLQKARSKNNSTLETE